MFCQISEDELFTLVNHQLNSNWGGLQGVGLCDKYVIHMALCRTEESFSKLKYINRSKNGEIEFHVENTNQYAMFLYYLSNSLYKFEKTYIASFVYYLNKIMNSVDLYYEVELPKHFGLQHPLGSVMGRAQYGDCFFFYQGCTVGANNNHHPQLGNNVVMCANSMILGKCIIGDNVIIGANSYIKDTDIPNNSLVFGRYPNLIIKSGHERIINNIIGQFWY